MPKVNEDKLSEQIEEIIISQLLFALTSLESPKQTASFLSDFLTDSETIMLSKRLAVSVLLLRGHTQTLITKMLSVSYSATGAVKSWLKNADPSTLVLLNSVAQADVWKEIVYNYKVLNQQNKKRKSRRTKDINQTKTVSVNKGQSSPIVPPPDIKTPDFDTIEGPELVLDEQTPSSPTEPSMEELLESE